MQEYNKKIADVLVDASMYVESKEELATFGDFFKKVFGDMATDAADAFNNLQKTRKFWNNST